MYSIYNYIYIILRYYRVLLSCFSNLSTGHNLKCEEDSLIVISE